MPRKKTETKTETKTDAKNEATNSGEYEVVDEGSTSIVFARQHLPNILRYSNLQDMLTMLGVNNHFADVVRELPEHNSLFGERLLSCFASGGAPRWAKARAYDRPRQAIVEMCYQCQRLGEIEAANRRVELRLPSKVLSNIEGWKQDVIDAAEELGRRCFMRWDVIDQIHNPEELEYTFSYVAGNLCFTAENKAASRIGVTSSCCKIWLDVGQGEAELPDEGKIGFEVDEGKKKEYMETVAVIEGDVFDSYCSWRKKTAASTSSAKSFLPAGTFDGSIVFTCRPGIGPAGSASVKFDRL